MGQVDLWILILLIPVQFISYFATGSIMFSYLRAKGNIQDMSHWGTTRLALELNFVNHALPSGGAAGFSYLAWVLKHHGVRPSRSTVAQIIRFLMTFLSFVILLTIAMVVLAFRHDISRGTVLMGAALVIGAILATWGVIWLVKGRARLERFTHWLTRTINNIVRWFTRGRKKQAVKYASLFDFFEGLHDDYLAVRRDRKVLVVPFVWAMVASVLDVLLIWIAFWSLGFPPDFAVLIIAYGLASIGAAVAVTPGGAGVYEAIMVAFLASSGMPPDVAIAGTLLARVVLLAGTIAFGYVFYQLTVLKYGKRPAER